MTFLSQAKIMPNPFIFAIVVVYSLIFYFIQENPHLEVLSASFLVILLIVFGKRGKTELKWENKGLPGREFFLPTILLLYFLASNIISTSVLFVVIKEKLPIICLILSFAVIANGLRKSEFFKWIAYKVVEKCAGNTRKLIFYMFIMSSVMTFFTSNDIVILTLTPILYAISIHANIKNAKLLFLSQFVAVNTLSMGLMMGSPTNIIIADTRLGFFEYFSLMIIPSIFTFIITLAIVAKINLASQGYPLIKKMSPLAKKMNWEFSKNYLPSSPQIPFSQSMRNWLCVFLLGIISLMISTSFSLSLYIPGFVIVLLSLLLLIYESFGDVGNSGNNKVKEIARTLFSLPFGIVGFAISYFVFAKFIGESDFVSTIMNFVFTLSEENPLLASPVIISLTGFLVNSVNDLPASALIAEALNSGGFSSLSDRASLIILQSVLVGLNIGCYLTPVGALAGIIWFNQLRLEERRFLSENKVSIGNEVSEILQIPTRIDLVVYGGLVFVITTVFTGMFIGLFSYIFA